MITQIDFRDCSYKEFCSEISILDIGDKSGTFRVKQSLRSFLEKNVRKESDTRLERYEEYTKKLYDILVTRSEISFDTFVQNINHFL